jgi:glutamate-5-semialdehyde dehydrogenase
MSTVRERVELAKSASLRLRRVGAAVRDQALAAIATALEREAASLDRANEADLTRAAADGVAAPLVKRLRFDAGKRAASADGVRAVAALPDPVGAIRLRRELDTGLTLRQESTPIGVIAMIFESRPDALVQIAALALKSGNALVLKGGSEALESNRALAALIDRVSVDAGAPAGWIQLVETREDVQRLLELDDLIDLMIPRGSNEFVRYIMDHTRIPVLGHADGVCHVYVDRAADRAIAERVVLDAKTQYVAVCNAAETLLIDEQIADEMLPGLVRALTDAGVALRGCERTVALVPGTPRATEDDWRAEYLDMILAVRVVASLEDAIAHINRYGSGHTDAIITADERRAAEFIEGVDTASVMVNASTRFADGFRYGLGAEVGISTSRIHARGPVGVEGLMSYKWIVEGSGHVVSDYASGARSFTHRDLPIEG